MARGARARVSHSTPTTHSTSDSAVSTPSMMRSGLRMNRSYRVGLLLMPRGMDGHQPDSSDPDSHELGEGASRSSVAGWNPEGAPGADPKSLLCTSRLAHDVALSRTS